MSGWTWGVLLGASALALTACSPEAPPVVQAAALTEAGEDPPLVLRVTQPDRSDWPEIEQRGVLRMLVPLDRTNFFFAGNRLRGMEYELVHEFERELSKERAGNRPQIDIAYVPVAFDNLLPALQEGLGDVAAGGLTITPEREQQVAFSEPYLTGVAQIVELTIQLRGEAGQRQRENAQVALAECSGGQIATDSAVAVVTILSI